MLKKLISNFSNNQLIIDSLWSVIGNTIGKGLALLAGILIARILGSEVYGEYGLIRNSILTIGIFSTLGLGYTSTKFIAELKNSEPEKIPAFVKLVKRISIYFSSIIGVLLYMFSKFIATNWFYADNLEISLKILSVLIILNAYTTTQIGILSGFGQFKKIAKVNMYIGIITFVLSISLTFYYDLIGALIALIVAQSFNCMFNAYYVNIEISKIQKKLSLDEGVFKEIMHYSLPIAIQEALYSLFTWLTSIILVRYSSFTDLGLYNAAMQWGGIILFIPGILRNVVLSHLVSNKNDKNKQEYIFKNTIKINFISTLIPCIFVIFFSQIIENSYGESFIGLRDVIIVIAVSTIFISISNIYNQLFMTFNENWRLLFIRIVRDGSILAFFIILFHFLKLRGVLLMSYAILFSSAIFMLIMMFVSKRILEKNRL